jgi:hypothetical protein
MNKDKENSPQYQNSRLEGFNLLNDPSSQDLSKYQLNNQSSLTNSMKPIQRSSIRAQKKKIRRLLPTKRPVEEIGLVPRSIIRTFSRFIKQIFFETTDLVVQEFRISRYQVLVSIQCLFLLIFIPLLTNFLATNFIFKPLTEYFWNANQNEIFLNSYQQNRAFLEMQQFENQLYFEILLNSQIEEKNELDETNQRTQHHLMNTLDKSTINGSLSSTNFLMINHENQLTNSSLIKNNRNLDQFHFEYPLSFEDFISKQKTNEAINATKLSNNSTLFFSLNELESNQDTIYPKLLNFDSYSINNPKQNDSYSKEFNLIHS